MCMYVICDDKCVMISDTLRKYVCFKLHEISIENLNDSALSFSIGLLKDFDNPLVKLSRLGVLVIFDFASSYFVLLSMFR